MMFRVSRFKAIVISTGVLLSLFAGILAVIFGFFDSSSDDSLANSDPVRRTDRDHIATIAVSRDGKRLLLGSFNHVAIYDLQNLTKIGETVGNEPEDEFGKCTELAFSPDGRTFVATGDTGLISEWYVDTGRRVPIDAAAAGDSGASFDWSKASLARRKAPNGAAQLQIVLPNRVEVRDTTSKANPLFAIEHRDFIRDAVYSPNGKWIVTASGSIETGARRGQLQIWDAKSGKRLGGRDFTEPVSSLAFTPDGKTLIYTYTTEVKRWETSTFFSP